MPGPPPPPPGGPPPMMPPPPPTFSSSSGPDDRSALLQSIRKGSKLKKTVTVDKSAPLISGKVSSGSSSSSSGGSSSLTASPSYRGGGGGGGVSVPNGLGGLFAGGMPKLKPTGMKMGGSTNSVNSSIPKTPESPSPKSFNSIQTELKKQMANDNRNLNRGPPPPAPVRTYNNQSEDVSTSSNRQWMKNSNSNGFHQNPSLPNLASINSPMTIKIPHRKTNSNVSLNHTDMMDGSINPRPVINHGKPNLAPKPPVNGKPAAPPKRLSMNGKPIGRAQSMRSPRSPSPQSPENNSDFPNKFGTVRNLSQVINQSLGHSMGNLAQVKPRAPLNGRPTVPPPSVPNAVPPPPPNKTVKAPSQAPPPPPSSIPQAPSQGPPPPPHRTNIHPPTRPPPMVPTNSAPPPPPRNSSMRDGSHNGPVRRTPSNTSTSSLDTRFHFHPVAEFPKPLKFRGMPKVYKTNRQVSNKQQAPPPPPNQVQLANRLWESSTC